MKIGLQMCTLWKYMDTPEAFEKTLRRVAEIGYRSVQITSPSFTNAVEVAEKLKECGLSADSAIHTVMSIPENIDQIVQNAAALNTNVLRTDSIPYEWRRSEEGYHRFAEHLEKCGKLLHERGLEFMYHAHSFEYIKLGDTRGMDILLSETSPEYVMFQPDVFWLASAGTEPSTELKRYAGRMHYLHLKDYVIVPTETEVLEVTKAISAPVGVGNLHWDAILSVAKEVGVDNVVVEDDFACYCDPFESAEISFENLTKML